MHQPNDHLSRYLAGQAAWIEGLISDDLQAVGDTELLDLLRHALLAGGKRVRPMLVLAASSLVGCSRPQERAAVRGLALAVEYLHVASLLHDDVIDNAEQRRGRPAANTLWGRSRVILAGDYLHARAMTLAGTAAGAEAIAILGQAISRMVEAEFLQHRMAAGRLRSTDAYLQVVEGKTAALIAAACELGALAGGGGASERTALRRYGSKLGIAFQVVDDLLDYLGDPDTTGKQVGNDFAEGKMTLPLLLAMQRASPEEQAHIGRLLDQRGERQAFADMQRLVERLDGFARARQQAAAMIDHALAALAPFADSAEKAALTGLARYVLERQR